MRINIRCSWIPGPSEENAVDGYWGLSLSKSSEGCCVVEGSVGVSHNEACNFDLVALPDGKQHALRDVISKARRGVYGLKIVNPGKASGPSPEKQGDGRRPESPWADDAVQFPRLLSELESAGAFTPEVMDTLKAEMDLTEDELSELVDRAQTAWERAKSGDMG